MTIRVPMTVTAAAAARGMTRVSRRCTDESRAHSNRPMAKGTMISREVAQQEEQGDQPGGDQQESPRPLARGAHEGRPNDDREVGVGDVTGSAIPWSVCGDTPSAGQRRTGAGVVTVPCRRSRAAAAGC